MTRPLDMLYNKLHGVDTPLHFKNVKQWKNVFKEIGLELHTLKRQVEKQWFYPFVEHMMFVVDKK